MKDIFDRNPKDHFIMNFLFELDKQEKKEQWDIKHQIRDNINTKFKLKEAIEKSTEDLKNDFNVFVWPELHAELKAIQDPREYFELTDKLGYTYGATENYDLSMKTNDTKYIREHIETFNQNHKHLNKTHNLERGNQETTKKGFFQRIFS